MVTLYNRTYFHPADQVGMNLLPGLTLSDLVATISFIVPAILHSISTVVLTILILILSLPIIHLAFWTIFPHCRVSPLYHLNHITHLLNLCSCPSNPLFFIALAFVTPILLSFAITISCLFTCFCYPCFMLCAPACPPIYKDQALPGLVFT